MANELAGKYDGTVIICGSAPSILDDRHDILYSLAALNRPLPMHIALNDAAAIVPAEFIVTAHPEKSERFKQNSSNPYALVLSGQAVGDFPVDCWFTDCNSGGTSAGMAIKIAKKLGFSEIILAGCPMNGGDGYYNSPPKPNRFGMTERIGNARADSTTVQSHRKHLMFEAANSDYSMVKSMSGWTAEQFGRPAYLIPRAAA